MPTDNNLPPEAHANPRLPDIHRLLPQSPDAEQGLLCSILLSPEPVINLCNAKGVEANWFHIPAHATLFQTMLDIWDTGKPLDIISLTHFMRGNDTLKTVGGPAFVTVLFTFLPTSANAAYYIEIIKEKRILRAIIKIGTEYAARAYDEQGQVAELEAGLIMAVEGLSSVCSMKDSTCVTEDSMLAVEERISQSVMGIDNGIATGIRRWDETIGKVRKGRMIVVGARPGVGKTAWLETVAVNMTRRGQKVLIFQRDMPVDDMMARIACREAGVVFEDFDQMKLPDEKCFLVGERMRSLNPQLLRVYSPAVFSIQNIRSIVRQEGGDCVVFVDVFQRLTETGEDNITESLTIQSKRARALTIEAGIPIILLAHMNRDADNTKRPHAGQFKYCDQLFSDTDTAVLMWSDDDPKNLRDPITKELRKQRVLLNVDKNRGGYVGEELIYFDRPKMRFYSSL